MSFITDIFNRGASVIIYVAALAIFIPLLITSARFADTTFFACVFAIENAPACLWCLIVKYVAAAVDQILTFLNRVASFLGAGSIQNSLSGQGGTPMQCVAKYPNAQDNLTYFYVIIWFIVIYLFIAICFALVRGTGKVITFATGPLTFIAKLFLNFFYADDTKKRPRKPAYRKLA